MAGTRSTRLPRHLRRVAPAALQGPNRNGDAAAAHGAGPCGHKRPRVDRRPCLQEVLRTPTGSLLPTLGRFNSYIDSGCRAAGTLAGQRRSPRRPLHVHGRSVLAGFEVRRAPARRRRQDKRPVDDGACLVSRLAAGAGRRRALFLVFLSVERSPSAVHHAAQELILSLDEPVGHIHRSVHDFSPAGWTLAVG